MVIETSAPGLSRLEVLLTSKEWKEPRRFVFEGKDSIVGGIALPKEYPAEYSMTAFDQEGKEAYSGKGPIPPVAVLDKPLDIALHGEKDEGLVVSLNRERIALEVRRSPESENEMVVHADVFDAQGNLAKIDPEELTWQLSDGRYINLHRKFEPFDINLVPDKGIQFAELCSLTPVVTACRFNTQCKAIKVCSDPFVKVSAGSNHTCALTQSGVAFCWGLNMDGQLGAPTTTSCISNSATGPKCSSRPVPVVCPAGVALPLHADFVGPDVDGGRRRQRRCLVLGPRPSGSSQGFRRARGQSGEVLPGSGRVRPRLCHIAVAQRSLVLGRQWLR